MDSTRVDRAISFIADSKQVAPAKPFFLYFAPGAQHAPHHVPKEWAVTQYFEMFAHRSLDHDGWRAVCPWPGHSFTEGRPFGAPLAAADLARLDGGGWELYHVAKDAAECDNVAADHRDRLIEMISLWYAEAGKYNVLPLDGRGTARLAELRPQLANDRTTYVYFPHTQAVPAGQAVRVLNRPHSITADVDIPAGGAEGVLVSMGGVDGGFVLFVQDGRLHYTYNDVAADWFRLSSSTPVPTGKSALRFEFEPTGPPDIANGKGTPGRAQLYIKRKLVGQTEFPFTIPLALGLAAGVCVGRDEGSPVCDDCPPPFEFTGPLHRITIDVSGDLVVDEEAEMKAILARQ